ncbi:hypothetical protein NX773_10685 [Massilia solisilvae]|uniref:Uncharacterized protein n=1 Tax=Massilia solisilvae TaxID=1811225 RepID=A0ABT2BJF7_9BURK|nr:hypothetical protein [Massilia solisilvae]MCS0608629.1 hypothetical protein [Massilia solisilvae]
MGKPKTEGDLAQPGGHLRVLVRFASLGGLFISMLGTALIWAGTDSFNCSSAVWKASLGLNLVLSGLVWLVYLPFRNTDRVLGNGLLAMFMLFSMFWVFGFAMLYFYPLFAPMSSWARVIALVGITSLLIHRAFAIFRDIEKALSGNKGLLARMYCDEGRSITFSREAVGLLERARTDRNPFRSYHVYAAMVVAPFVLVLNRILSPIFGDGHGLFLVLGFFAVPITLWGVEIFVQTIVTMICYPIRLERSTGKPVLLKDW